MIHRQSYDNTRLQVIQPSPVAASQKTSGKKCSECGRRGRALFPVIGVAGGLTNLCRDCDNRHRQELADWAGGLQ